MATAAELAILITAKDAASKVIDGLGKSFGGLGAAGKVAGVALAGFATAGAGIVAGLGASIGAAASFESAMSGVAAVAGASKEQLAELSEAALQLGQDTSLSGIGATEAAQAMQALVAAGVSVEDVLNGAARGALLLASAGGIDVVRAAEIAANALNQFGLAGSEAGRVADLLAGAANASSADVSDLGESLKYIGPIAKTMGLSIEEVTATLAALAAQGIKADQAGTSLRAIILGLASPSKEAAELIGDLGLEFFDAAGKMKSLAGISEELRTKLAGMTDQQRAAALSTLFSNNAVSAATILYGEGAAGIEEYLKAITEGAGAAETGRIRNDNLKGSIEQLKSSLETASITLGQAFLPAIKGLVDLATRAVGAAIPFIKVWGPNLTAALTASIAAVAAFGQKVGGAIGAVVEAFRALLGGDINFAQFVGGMEIWASTILGKLGELATRAAPYLGQFFSAVGSFIAAAAPQVAAQFGVWAQAFVGWITSTALPAVLVQLAAWQAGIVNWLVSTALPALIPALTALGTAFGDWVTTSAVPAVQATLGQWATAIGTFVTSTALPTIQAALLTLGTALGAWVQTVAIPAVQAAMPAWVQTIVANIQSVLPFVQQFADALRAGIGGAIAAIVPLVQQFGAAFQSELPRIIALGSQMRAIWEQLAPVMEALKPIGIALAAVLGTLLVAQIGFLLGALGGLVGMFTGILPGAIMVAQGTLMVIQGVIAAVSAVVQGMVAVVTALLQGDWAGAWRAAEQTIAQFTAAVTQIMTGLWTIVVGIFTAAIGAITGLIGGFVTTVTAYFQAIYTSVTGSTLDLSNVVQDAWAAVVEGVTSAVARVVDAVTDGFARATAAVSDAVGQLPGIVLAIGGAMYNAGASIIHQLAAGIDSAIGAAIQRVKDGLQEIANLLPGSEPKDTSSPLRGLIDRGRAIFENLSEGMGEGIPLTTGAIREATDQIAEAIRRALGDMGLIGGVDLDKTASAIVKRFATDFEVALDWMKQAASAAGDFLSEANAYRDLIRMAVAAIKEAQGLLNQIGGGPSPSEAGAALGQSLAEGTKRELEIRSPSKVFAQIGRDVIAGLVEGMDEKQQDAAKKAAEVAKAIADAVSSGVEAFTKLGTFVAPAPAAVYAFGKTLRMVIKDLEVISEQVTADAAAIAATFGENAGKAVGFFAEGVAGFVALKDFVQPAPAAIFAFGKTIRMVINDLALVAEQVGVEAAALAGEFADGAGRAIGIIGNAVEGFVALAEFVRPAPAAVEAFSATVLEVVAAFGRAAALVGEKAVGQARSFGEAAGSIFSALKSGLDLFREIDEPGGWPVTDWLQPLIELMAGVLSRGGQLLTQSEQLKAIAEAFAANIASAQGTFSMGLLGGTGLALATPGLSGGGGTTIVNNYYITGNTMLSKDSATQQQVAGIVTTAQNQSIGYVA
jgi:TP901 family phage tail tape measure protein